MAVPFHDLEPEVQAAVEKACAHISDLGPVSALTIEPLQGGMTNRNYRLSGSARDVVLRLHGKDTELLGINRRHEHQAATQAAGLGIGPGVAALLEPERFLVTEFVPATAANLSDPNVLTAIVDAIRRWHDSRAISGFFNTFGLAERFANAAAARGVALVESVGQAIELSRTIGAVFGTIGEAMVPCHNDLLGANFLSSTTDIGVVWLIDWEYAGMNSRWFDLGNFSVNNGFDAATDESMLQLYFGEVTPVESARLTLMKVMSDVREAMWGVVQQGISTLDFDYANYADEHFDRMMMNATKPAFAQALRIAGA